MERPGKQFGILTAATAILLTMIGTARADSCENFTAQYERANGIPAHLLTAMARAESGRYDPDGGGIRAWPWAVTSPEGDIKYATKRDAVDAVKDLKSRGVTNIDVGCMQINVHHHPEAFRNLNHAFDPEANVAYAAHYLKQQYGRTADWRMAVAYYHSTNPTHYGPYAAKVEGLWVQARADARFYGQDDIQLADSNGDWASDADWLVYRNYPYWADPHWTPDQAAIADRPRWWRGSYRWGSYRWGRPIRWYGDRTATSAGADDYVGTWRAGPWRAVGTNRFN